MGRAAEFDLLQGGDAAGDFVAGGVSDRGRVGQLVVDEGRQGEARQEEEGSERRPIRPGVPAGAGCAQPRNCRRDPGDDKQSESGEGSEEKPEQKQDDDAQLHIDGGAGGNEQRPECQVE